MPGSNVTPTYWNTHVVGNQGYVVITGTPPTGMSAFPGTHLLTLDDTTYMYNGVVYRLDLGGGATITMEVRGGYGEIAFSLFAPVPAIVNLKHTIGSEAGVLAAFRDGETQTFAGNNDSSGVTWSDLQIQWTGTRVDGVDPPAGGASAVCAFMAVQRISQAGDGIMDLRQSTASQEVPLGPFLDDSDLSALTGLTIANTDIKIWKSGGSAFASKNSGGATHDATGKYIATFDATDSNTLGPLEICVQVSGALPVTKQCEVLSADVYDQKYGSTAIGGGNLTAILGTNLTETSAGYLAAGVKKVFDVATPVFTAASVNQTGDAYAKVDTEVADIQARLPAALAADGYMKCSLLGIMGTALTETAGYLAAGFKQMFNVATPTSTMNQITLVDTVTNLTNGPSGGVDVTKINGSTTGVDAFGQAVRAITQATVGTGSTTTSIVTSAMDPAANSLNQFKDQAVCFAKDTTTVALRGHKTPILASDSSGVLSVKAMPAAPVSGDKFTIQ